MSDLKLRQFQNFKEAHDGYIWKGAIPEAESIRKSPENHWELPKMLVQSLDISNMDLSAYNMQNITFDDQTEWPKDLSKCPKGYAQLDKIIEYGKNPGLGIHALHKKGIDGKGMYIAIIDQPLSDHVEYHDNLVHYEEIGYKKNGIEGGMHGSAVSSIAVGKNCGVAPKAKLYYFAANNCLEDRNGNKISDKDGKHILTAEYYAKALQRILEINESLPDDQKIQVVSVSWAGQSQPETEYSAKWWKVLEKAKEAGLFVLTVASAKEYSLNFKGMGKKADGDPESVDSYFEGYYLKPTKIKKEEAKDWEQLKNSWTKAINVPMEHRTLASPTSKDEYVHYAASGMSWATPWLAGMFVLARQINPKITPKHFWEEALKTGIFNEKTQGKIIQPQELIRSLQNEKTCYITQNLITKGRTHA